MSTNPPILPDLVLPPGEAEKYVSFMHKELNRKIYEQLKKPDLNEFINSQKNQPHLAPEETIEFNQRPRLLDVIKEPLKNPLSRAHFGFFDILKCAYVISRDNIYLWSYEFGTSQEITSPEGNIFSAQVVPPKPDIFSPETTSVLVLVHSDRIRLFGLSIGDGQLVKVQRGDYSVPITFQVTAIVGTALGRILIGSDHGCIYEINYQKEETFFQKKVSLVNCSMGYIASIPLNLGLFKPKNTIISLVLDDQRKLLYALSELSEIMVFNLGRGGNELNFVFTESDILSKALRINRNINSTRICGIQLIPPSDSETLRLLAVTEKNHIIFFRSNKSLDYQSTSGLVIDSISMSTLETPSLINTSERVFRYHRGTLVLGSPESNSLSKIAIQFLARAPGVNNDKLLLQYNTTQIESQVRDVIEADPPSRLTYMLAASPTYFDDLISQYYQPARKFYMLDNQGISSITKLRPVDQLLNILTNQHSAKTKLTDFLRRYGPSEACAMIMALMSGYPLALSQSNTNITSCKSLLCSIGLLLTYLKQVFDRSSVTSKPSSVLFTKLYTIFSEISGNPSQLNFVPNPYNSSGSSQSIQPFIYSNAFYGLLLFSARLLCPIWTYRIFSISVNPDKTITAKFNIPHDTLLLVKRSISELLLLLPKLPAFDPTKPCSVFAETHEKASVHQFKELLSLCIQSLSFVNLLYERKVDHLAKFLAPTSIQKLPNVSIEFLLASPYRQETINDLVKLLINHPAANSVQLPAGTSTIYDTLVAQCADLCDSGKLPLIGGLEMIKIAEAQLTLESKKPLLIRAQNYFLKCEKAIPKDELKDILIKYGQQGYQIGGLCLISDNALKFKSKCSDASLVKEYYELVEIPLNSLISELKLRYNTDTLVSQYVRRNLKELLSGNHDENYHSAIYNWLYKNDLNSVTFDVASSSYFNSFIKSIPLSSRKRIELMNNFFTANDQYQSAARFLYDSATCESNLELGEEDRRELLSLANGASKIKNAKDRLPDFPNLAHKIQNAHKRAKLSSESPNR